MPEFAQVRRWPSCEVNGLILVWFHCDGKDPEWTVPEYEEITNGKWVYRGRTEHFINAHIQVGVHVCKQTRQRQDGNKLQLAFNMNIVHVIFWYIQRAPFCRKSLKMHQTWLTWVTCTRRAWRAALICATPTAKPGNSCDTTGRWVSGLMFKMDTACCYSFLKAESPVPPGRNRRLQPRAAVLLRIIDSLCLNYTKHVFLKGPVGTRVGAEPTLFSDVCETFFNPVWAPLPSTGR